MKHSIIKVISMLILFGGLIGVMVLSGGEAGIMAYIDQPSLYLIIVFTLAMLLFSNTFGDYLMGIKVAAAHVESTTNELKAALNAIDLAIILVFMSGIIGSFIGGIVILATLEEAQSLRHAFSVDFIVLLYSLIINLIHFGIRAKIKKELIYRG